MRTCRINGKNYMFHCWEHYSEIIEPSVLKGGHSGGVIGCTFGIVEDENGKVFRVPAYEIQFTDNIFREYAFTSLTEIMIYSEGE